MHFFSGSLSTHHDLTIANDTRWVMCFVSKLSWWQSRLPLNHGWQESQLLHFKLPAVILTAVSKEQTKDSRENSRKQRVLQNNYKKILKNHKEAIFLITYWDLTIRWLVKCVVSILIINLCNLFELLYSSDFTCSELNLNWKVDLVPAVTPTWPDFKWAGVAGVADLLRASWLCSLNLL